jgi:hypothetical protein
MKVKTEEMTVEASGKLDASGAGTFLLPQFSNSTRPTAATVLKGMLIYNTTTNKLQVCTGAAWEAVTSA